TPQSAQVHVTGPSGTSHSCGCRQCSAMPLLLSCVIRTLLFSVTRHGLAPIARIRARNQVEYLAAHRTPPAAGTGRKVPDGVWSLGLALHGAMGEGGRGVRNALISFRNWNSCYGQSVLGRRVHSTPLWFGLGSLILAGPLHALWT